MIAESKDFLSGFMMLRDFLWLRIMAARRCSAGGRLSEFFGKLDFARFEEVGEVPFYRGCEHHIRYDFRKIHSVGVQCLTAHLQGFAEGEHLETLEKLNAKKDVR